MTARMSLARRRGGRRLRVLMLIHVDWDWIRQRPHALAEELDRLPDLDVRVAYLPNWRRGRLARNGSPVHRIPVPRLPFGRFGLIAAINRLLGQAFMALLLRLLRPDATTVAYPSLYPLVERSRHRGRLFYDCMDLATGFARSGAERVALEAEERRLLAACAGVFASSAYLVRHLEPRVPAGVPVVLVRNGIGADVRRVSLPPPPGALRLGYFGTISEWFDLDLVRALLAAEPDLEMHLWGPIAGRIAPVDRLELHPPVEHDRLADIAGAVHALIMPFIVSDLIRGVDPVKLYEYVALGRPVISVYYPELEPFRGLVTFYETAAELAEAIARLRREPDAMAPDPDRAAAFLGACSWHARAAIMADSIRGIAGAAA